MNVYFCERNTLYASRLRDHLRVQGNDVIAKPIATSATLPNNAAGSARTSYDDSRMKLTINSKFRSYLQDYERVRTIWHYAMAPFVSAIESFLQTASKYILPQLQVILTNCNGDMNRFMEIVAENEAYYCGNPSETFRIITTKIIYTWTYAYYCTTSITRFLIKTALEKSAVTYLSPKYADKLTKSVIASYLRKLRRFNSRFSASFRLVKTYIYANLITEISFACIESLADNLIYPIYTLCYPPPCTSTELIKKGNVVGQALPIIARSLFHRSVNLVIYSVFHSIGCSIHVFPTHNCGNILVFVASVVDPSRILFGAYPFGL